MILDYALSRRIQEHTDNFFCAKILSQSLCAVNDLDDEEKAMLNDLEQYGHRISKRFDAQLAKGVTVNVTIPEILEVRLVDASMLADYESWFFFASVLANAAVGFLVAGLESKSISLLVTALVFSILFAVALIMAMVKRHKLRRRRKAVTLRTR